MAFRFHQSEQYAFLYENVHLLMVTWTRDNAKFLFRIEAQSENGELQLDYPGETFSNRVLDNLERIFFIQVQSENSAGKAYVLGSYFEVDGQMYGAYYERQAEQRPEVVLFKLEGEAPNHSLEVPSEEEYQRAAAAFSEQHADLMDIERANRQS